MTPSAVCCLARWVLLVLVAPCAPQALAQTSAPVSVDQAASATAAAEAIVVTEADLRSLVSLAQLAQWLPPSTFAVTVCIEGSHTWHLPADRSGVLSDRLEEALRQAHEQCVRAVSGDGLTPIEETPLRLVAEARGLFQARLRQLMPASLALQACLGPTAPQSQQQTCFQRLMGRAMSAQEAAWLVSTARAPANGPGDPGKGLQRHVDTAAR